MLIRMLTKVIPNTKKERERDRINHLRPQLRLSPKLKCFINGCVCFVGFVAPAVAYVATEQPLLGVFGTFTIL